MSSSEPCARRPFGRGWRFRQAGPLLRPRRRVQRSFNLGVFSVLGDGFAVVFKLRVEMRVAPPMNVLHSGTQ